MSEGMSQYYPGFVALARQKGWAMKHLFPHEIYPLYYAVFQNSKREWKHYCFSKDYMYEFMYNKAIEDGVAEFESTAVLKTKKALIDSLNEETGMDFKGKF